MKSRNSYYMFFWVLCLSFLSGFINVFTIYKFNVTITHYTGNLSKLAISLSLFNLNDILFIFSIVFLFFLGSFISGLLFSDRSFDIKKRYGVLLIIIGFINIVFSYSRIILFCIAFIIGIQNSMFINYNGMLVRTSHFTGYLTDAGFEFGRFVKGEEYSFYRFLFYFFNILSFILGGFISIFLILKFNTNNLFISGFIYISLGIYYLNFKKHFINKLY